jgi:hypothetical protein
MKWLDGMLDHPMFGSLLQAFFPTISALSANHPVAEELPAHRSRSLDVYNERHEAK